MKVVVETKIQDFPLIARGKVRDIYKIDKDTLLIVTTDRMSAFDVVLKNPIPYKGVVLNLLTLFWMERFSSLVENHIIEAHIEDFPSALKKYSSELEGRAVIVKKATPLPIECIVRGYITGSGWKDYIKKGEICGHKLPPGLKESQKLPRPLFTPSTKAEVGQHDENITVEKAREKLGDALVKEVEKISIEIYERASEYALNKGIIIADTKFEFGLKEDKLYLIDEVLTPDSSRFWPKEDYEPGRPQKSFDKQYLRDWLSENWNKKGEPPSLPSDVIETTHKKYIEAFEKLTGQTLNL